MMKQLAALLVLLSALGLTSAEGETPAAEGAVIELTNETLPLAVKSHPLLLVEFYAPWCGHCKALEPEYAKAAAQLQAENSAIRLAKIDVTAYEDVGNKYEIHGFPTLRLFVEDKSPAEYGGQRSAESIVSWLKRKSGPAALTLTETSELTKIRENHIAVVGFFKDVSSPAAQAFLATAYALDNTQFAITSSEALFAENQIEGAQGVVLFKQFDEGRSVFAGDYTTEALTEFIKQQSMPLVPEVTSSNAQEVFGGDVKAHLLMFNAKSSPGYETSLQNARKVAPQYRGKVLFAAINTDDDDMKQVVDFFGLKQHQLPAYRLAALQESGVKRFKPDSSDMSEEQLSAFAARYVAGELQPQLLSEELPADWDAHPVKVLVSTNYKAITRDSGKKVIVELYAPWCGHCKQLAPIWEELGEKFKSSSDVIVAKFDGTANEVEGLQLFSYPTIKLYLPGVEKEIDYFGARTLEGLAKFVDSNGAEQAPAPEEDEQALEEEESTEEAAAADGGISASVDESSHGDAHDHAHGDGHGHSHDHSEL